MRRLSARVILTIAVTVAIAVYAIYAITSSPGTVNIPNPPTSFTVNGKTYSLTFVAANESSRESGLMNRKVTNSTTMLFVFPSQGNYQFWMKDVNTSLDIIWMRVTNNLGTVVYVANDVPGCTSGLLCPNYGPSAEANWVLEVKGGFSEANGVVAGTTIGFH